MLTEVYIGGNLIDIDQSEIVAGSYGNVNFGTLGKRTGAKTNTWKAPFSTRNKQVFEGSELVSSWSDMPYKRSTIRVDIDGVSVFEGWCILDQSSDSYEIISFAGASDFYSVVSNSRLRDIDLSQYDHVWNETVVKNSFTRTSGFVYAFVEYGKEWPFSTIPVDYLKPQIFFKDVIQAIVEFAGYTLSGKVLTELRYQKHVIIPSNVPYIYALGDTISLSAILPDLTQSKVWLDFANIYGLQFNVNDQTKEIVASYIDDLLFNDPEDWTSKVDRTEDFNVDYRFDSFGKKSYLRYKSFDAAGATFVGNPKEIPIDDGYLKEAADVYQSEFSLIQNVTTPTVWNTYSFVLKNGYGFAGIWRSVTTYVFGGGNTAVWYNGTYYKPLQDSTNKIPPAEPTYWQVVAEKDIWDFNTRPMYGYLVQDPSFYINVDYSTGPEIITRKITNQSLTWPEIYPEHYRVFSRIIEKTKIVDALIKLNYADVNQIDFTRLKIVDGEMYMAQEIKQFKMNAPDSTIVTLVRV